MLVQGMDCRRPTESGQSFDHLFVAGEAVRVEGEEVGIAGEMNMVVKGDKASYASVEDEGFESIMDGTQVEKESLPTRVVVAAVAAVVDEDWDRPREVQHQPTPKWLHRPIAPAWAFCANSL